MPRHLFSNDPRRLTRRALLRRGITGLAGVGLVGNAVAGDRPRDDVVRPQARAQTTPVPNGGDAADDPALWIHPSDPALSLLLGTDKRGGLHAYDLDGRRRQIVADGSLPNNVDVLYGFPLGGRDVDLAVASVRAASGRGIRIWRIDPAARSLSEVTEGGLLRVLGGGEPYGCCVYRAARTGRHYFFVNSKSGAIEQHLLEDAGGGRVRSRSVRTLRLRSQPEGMVADDELGHLYVGEESAGVWKFSAEADAAAAGRLIARVGENGLRADVEGLTIYCATKGRGYLIVSSQGNNTFKVYDRAGANAFILTIDPAGGDIDDVSDTDGICVTSCPTSKAFPRGLFVVQDGSNAGGNQNFKLYAWQDIAGDRLLIDTGWSPRRG